MIQVMYKINTSNDDWREGGSEVVAFFSLWNLSVVDVLLPSARDTYKRSEM